MDDAKLRALREAAAGAIQNKKVGAIVCPICKTHDWTVGDQAQIAFRHNRRNLYPALPVMCDNCGYTIFFNSIILGVASSTGQPAPKEDTAQQPPDAETEP
jgi:hypothetical protein